MLRKAFEEVVPYIMNLSKIKEFVNENENKDVEELLNLLNQEIANNEGTLKTDFKILLNEYEKIINKRM